MQARIAPSGLTCAAWPHAHWKFRSRSRSVRAGCRARRPVAAGGCLHRTGRRRTRVSLLLYAGRSEAVALLIAEAVELVKGQPVHPQTIQQHC